MKDGTMFSVRSGYIRQKPTSEMKSRACSSVRMVPPSRCHLCARSCCRSCSVMDGSPLASGAAQLILCNARNHDHSMSRDIGYRKLSLRLPAAHHGPAHLKQHKQLPAVSTRCGLPQYREGVGTLSLCVALHCQLLESIVRARS